HIGHFKTDKLKHIGHHLVRFKLKIDRIYRFLTLLLCAALLLPFLVTPAKAQQVSSSAVIPKVAAYKSEPSSAATNWANEELKRMSLEEKIGQLISVGINATFLNQDSDAYRSLKRQIEDNHIGGIILFRGPVYESVILVNRMQ